MERQILDILNTGIVILDSRYQVVLWNHWMEINSGMGREDIEGTLLFKHFPQLNTPFFIRSIKSVLKFNNYVYLSQKLHTYLFPFPARGIYAKEYDYMQQSCSLIPLDENGEKLIVLTVQNVTETVYLEQNLRDLTRLDGLTGIFNRRYLDKRLDEEFLRYKRSGRSYCLIMLDIDDFKQVNDTYGHPFGDVVIRELAQLCSEGIRGSDIVARFGGEEFSIVLLDTEGEGAMVFAERLRKRVEQYSFNKDGVSHSITASLGVSAVSPGMEDSREMIEQADKALYASKESGKNCATLYQDDLHKEKPNKAFY